MPLIRSEVTVQNYTTEPPKNNSVNTVYHEILDGFFDPSVSYQSHSDEILALFHGSKTGAGSTFKEYKDRALVVKVYDMADAKPRPVHATSSVANSGLGTDAVLGPRQVQLCCSFFAGRNLPHTRGRTFIGPIGNVETALRPSSALMNQLLDFGHGLFDIGGENVSHRVYSETLGTSSVVTNYWVNDVWDTLRGRLEKESTRLTLAP